MSDQPGGSGQRAGGKGGLGRRSPRVVTITAVLVVIALGVVGSVLWASGAGRRPAEPTAAQVRLEAISTPGDNPFTDPVGQDEVTAPTPGAAGTFSGDTPGLFAGTGDERSCDRQALVANLQADSAKASAWAAALEIDAADIPGFVQSLTPVVLRADTAVTSYGYEGGTFVPYPAVLQAGTAVFVNGFGEPTVKCFSGNPLTRPAEYAQAEYVGQPWGYWEPRSVVYVQPSPVVVNKYIYVDQGRRYEHRSWCAEHSDSPYCARPNPVVSCEKNPYFAGCQAGNKGGSAREQFCKANPGKCDANGIPFLCKGVNGPGADPRCTGPNPGGIPGGAPGGTQVDPVLLENLKKATQAAAEARAAADAKKADADAAALALTDAQADRAAKADALNKAKQDLAKAQAEAKEAQDALFKNPNDPDLRLKFLQADNFRSEKIEAVNALTTQEAAAVAAVKNASDEAQQRANQAKYAEAAAADAEAVQKVVEKNVKDAQTKGQQGQKGQQNQNAPQGQNEQQLQQQQQQQQKQNQQLQPGQQGQNRQLQPGQQGQNQQLQPGQQGQNQQLPQQQLNQQQEQGQNGQQPNQQKQQDQQKQPNQQQEQQEQGQNQNGG